jgi:hypothetical protein
VSNSKTLDKIHQEVIRTTTDLPLMAFYLMNGIELLKVECHNNSSKQTFYFRDDDDRASVLRVQWANSEMRTFDNAIRTLKKLCHEMQRKPIRRRNNGVGLPAQ